METKFLLLWLESPLQSWGFDSKFGRRDTLEFPTKSGILGLLLCALGKSGEQKELLLRFADLKQTVISFCDSGKAKSAFLHDFQMIGSGYDEKNSWEKHNIPKTSEGKSAVGGGTKLTHRFYLQNAVFAVLLEVSLDLAEECENALKNPVYPIYFGRKCCVPSDFVYQGTFETENDAKSAAVEKSRNHESRSLVPSFFVIDGKDDGGDSFTLNDVPIQFGTQKKYRDRRVTKIAWREDG